MSRHAKATSAHTFGGPTKGVHVLSQFEHDAYREDEKYAEPTTCPQCHASFVEGRWRWTQAPHGAPEALCPACRRTRDHYPAGMVTLEGDFIAAHHDEVMQLIRHRAERAGREHPLQRIMEIREEDGAVHIDTTDLHLARGLGEALHHAYRGDLKFHYKDTQDLLRVHWQRSLP